MKYVIVFVILNLACKFTEAQELNFQLYFRPGLSKMNDQRHHLNPDKFQIKYQPCYDIGIRINNRFSNLEAIGVAGSIITVNSNENMMYYNPDFKLHTYSKLKYRLSYFSVNIYNSVSIKRINCNLGMSALVLLKSKGNLSGYMVDSMGKTFNKVANI